MAVRAALAALFVVAARRLGRPYPYSRKAHLDFSLVVPLSIPLSNFQLFVILKGGAHLGRSGHHGRPVRPGRPPPWPPLPELQKNSPCFFPSGSFINSFIKLSTFRHLKGGAHLGRSGHPGRPIRPGRPGRPCKDCRRARTIYGSIWMVYKGI